MEKFLQVFRISFRQEFAYKLNFIMWRVRNVMQILMFFFLWDAVFSSGVSQVFSYDRTKILTYAFVLILVRAIILSSRSVDVAAQIADGDLTNSLLKPINFFDYWVLRDLSSKILNIVFGIFEVTVLVYLFKPPIFLQTNPFYFLFFVISLIVAIYIFFNILMLTNFVTFWIPELHWGAQFLVIVVLVESLSGSFFPIDVFPQTVYQILKFTPFPSLIFVPIQTYLGNFSEAQVLQSIFIGLIWSFILSRISRAVWKKGLLVYEGVGR